MFWDNYQFLRSFNSILGGCLVFAGLFVAVGLVGQHYISKQVETLAVQFQAKIKNTPPIMGAGLAFDKDGDLRVIVASENLVPVFIKWGVLTKKDVYVSGWMPTSVKWHPKEGQQFEKKITLQENGIVDNFIEFRLQYHSIHSPELGYPKELQGQIFHKYRYENGELKHMKETRE